jgi:SAM-dependent methyltransferase
VPVGSHAAHVALDYLDFLSCPACKADLIEREASLVCTGCNAAYSVSDAIPALRCAQDAATEGVRAFYTHAPFPGYPPSESLSGLRRKAERSELARLLDRAIPGDASVLEVGCGTGQMSLFLARADRVVIGADLTRASLELAREAGARFGIDRVAFVETDLRSPGLRDEAFDVVYCSGVLHHTPDPRSSFASIARLVKPGGFVVVGLYNVYARLPHRLRRAVARLSGLRWFPLDPVLRDRSAEPARREAWVRDQYEHPLEHRHTVADVQRWFRENAVDYLRTYPSTLIGHEPLEADELFTPAEDDWSFENVLSQIGWARTLWSEGGLFVVIGQKVPRPATR